MSRRLRLSSEHLTDLTPDELSILAGANAEVTLVCVPSWFHEMRHVIDRALYELLYTETCRC